MNDIDRSVLLEQTLDHAIKYADRLGKRERHQSARTVAKVHAANALKFFNGTIDWDPHECPMGYSTIYHHIAGEYFGAGLKPMDKAEQATDNHEQMKLGFRSLRETMLEQHNVLVYMVPRTVNGLKIEVITIDPDYMVEPTAELTADDISTQRDSKQAQGQVRSAFERQVKVHGRDAAVHNIESAVQKAIAAPVNPPTGTADHPPAK